MSTRPVAGLCAVARVLCAVAPGTSYPSSPGSRAVHTGAMPRRTRRSRQAAPSVGELLSDVWDEHRNLFAVYHGTPDAWREAGDEARAVAGEVESLLGSAVERYGADHPLPAT